MFIDIRKIKNFYGSDLGNYAHRILNDIIVDLTCHCPKRQANIVLSAGAEIFADHFSQHENSVCLQTEHSPSGFEGNTEKPCVVMSRDLWPYRAESIDMVVLMHDLEFAENPDVYLKEAWRVLKGEGSLIVTVPHRGGYWSRIANTPFGKGYPYAQKQIVKLLAKNHFAVEAIRPVLFYPPKEVPNIIEKCARYVVDRWGNLCMLPSGVLILKANKHVYSSGGGLKQNAISLKPALGIRPQAATFQSKKLMK